MLLSSRLVVAAAVLVAALALLAGTAEAQTGKAESRMAARLAEVALGDHVGKKVIKKAADRIFRRSLQQRDRYISYQALRANSIPCGKQGNSYYNCSYKIQANPYSRGCTEATRCFRYTH